MSCVIFTAGQMKQKVCALGPDVPGQTAAVFRDTSLYLTVVCLSVNAESERVNEG